MKKTKLIANLAGLCCILCIAAILLIQGCKKNDKVNLADEIKDISNYYSKNVTSANLNPFSALTPDWNNVYVHEDGQEVIYEIELQNPKKVIESDHQLKSNDAVNFSGNIIRLLVFKNKQDNVINGGCYMSISSNDDIAVINIKYKHPDNFSGKISYYNLNGSFSNGWMYAKGEITKRISLSSREAYMLNNKYPDLVGSAGKISNTKGEKVMLKQAVACYPGVPQFIYGTVCAGDDSGEVVCTTKLTAVIYTEFCEGGGSDNNDGGYTPPGGGGTTYIVDCNGDRNGKAYDSDCGCIGGNTGITECPKEIIDSLTNECLKTALAKAKGVSGKNFTDTISKIITSLDANTKIKVGVSNVSQILDKDGNNVVVGRTTGYNYDGGVFTCSIRLNESILNNATQEYAVATIIHETLHAYLQYKAGNTLSHGQNHEDISKNYIVPFVNLMKSIFPNMDLKDATAIAWGGVQGTSLWQDSYKNDSFKIGGTNQTMDFSTMKGLENAHHSGYADNSTPLCPKK
jgi:hypothetical protein